MGNTFKTGNYVNGIFQDASNNIGIGAAPSGSYKLEVTGTAKVSSTLLLGGALTGAAATFSGIVTAGDSGGGQVFRTANAGTSSVGIRLTNTGGNSFIGLSNSSGTGYLSGTAYALNIQTESARDLQFGTNNVKRLTIASTGEATFSSSVSATAITATGLLYGNGGESNTLYTGAFFWTPGSYNFFNQKTDHSLVIGTYNVNNPVAAITIAQSGATTFSSDIAATKAYFTTTENAVNITSSSSASNVQLKVNNGTNGDIYAGVSASGGASVFTGTTAYSGYIGTNQATPFQIATSGIVRMTIASNGNIGAPSGSNIYNASDIRLKQNITTIVNGLDKIIALNPVKFNWIDGFEESEDGKDMLGFVAQEVQNAIPEAVEGFGNNSVTIGENIIDNPLRVNEKFIIPVLVAAIKELNQTITSLQERLNKAGL